MTRDDALLICRLAHTAAARELRMWGRLRRLGLKVPKRPPIAAYQDPEYLAARALLAGKTSTRAEQAKRLRPRQTLIRGGQLGGDSITLRR